MQKYRFNGHLSPLPPGIDLPLQISGDVYLDADVRALQGDLIRLAADLARCTGMPSEHFEDHKPRRSRSYWLGQIEQACNTNRGLAMRLRQIADRLSAGKTNDAR